MINTITLLGHCVVSACLIHLFLMIFYFSGSVINYCFNFNNFKSESYKVLLGLSLVLFLGWYAFQLKLINDLFFNLIFIIPFILILSFYIFGRFNRKAILTNLIDKQFWLTSLLFSLFYNFLFAWLFKDKSTAVSSLGNLDLYNWSLMADYVKNGTGMHNILPIGEDFIKGNIFDCWGTYFILAMLAKFLNLTGIESTTYFILFILTIFSMVIYEISKRIFHLSSRESFFLGIIVCSNSFVLYIAFKHFLSELIALVFFTGGLLSAYELGYNKASPIKKTILMMPILIGLLICYQSAVIIFYLYLALAIIIFSLKIDIKRKKLIGLKTSFKNFIFFSLSILFTFMLLPQELKCVIDRIGVGLHASFGWPLDFLSFYQLVVPSLFMFPSNTQSYFAVELLFDLIFLGIIAQILWTVKRSNEKLFWVITKFLVLILLAILGYLVMSSHFGASYQTWKFASYLFIPLGFIMPILFIKTSALSKWLFIILNIICLHKQYKHFNPRNISNEIQEFNILRESFPKEYEGKKIVLKLSPLNDQIANTLLNDKFKLVSKYITGANNFDNYIKTLNAENTYVLFKPENLSIKESKVMTLKQYANEVKLTLNKKFLFSDLESYDSIQLIKGFSSAEPWGVWTESKEAILELTMPENLVKCDLVLLFKIRPFLSQKNNHQDFSIFINDHFIKDVTLSSDTEINVKLSSKDLSRNSKIRLRFNVKNPISPHDIDIKLLDTRKLALGFISMKINKDSI